MIGNAALIFQWANDLQQEERDLRLWMHSNAETSRVMNHIDHVDVLPSLVVPLLKACKYRYLSDDIMPEGKLRGMIHALHSNPILPALVSIIPSDWDDISINAVELAIISHTLDTKYPGIRGELNGENWKANSLALIKAISVLEVHARFREQAAYRSVGGNGFVRPDVGNHYLSEDMARFVIDSPDKGEEIIDVMITRRTSDFDLISSIINSDAKALSAGEL